MTRAQPNIWPPRQMPRTLQPADRAPERDVAALIQRHGNTIANLPVHVRCEIREMSVLSMMQVMRDCDDRKTRADAYDVLVKMGVFAPC